ncbi:DUF1524 domain-containing protein [Leifsonia sp. fls2-241-R2A-40a]|uniref:GmrSD restriction endonuclease domain-containing protein n=1 Tax=Leifsonia sp. fls2-241-R2A-40a TaxID=3040290 RepID=UPI002549DBFB|nr:DUF1524 domain-containing protein [Leifsonia sp. fls2-241-R2A-40a]
MTDSPLPPAGWYPNPDDAGELRWWDGTAWTDHTAEPGTVAPAAAAVRPARAARRIPLSTWLGGGLTLLLLALVAPAGFGAVLVLLGVVALFTGLYTVITRRRGWALLPKSRPIGLGVLGGAVVLFIVGGSIAAGAHPVDAVDAASVRTTTPSRTPSATPTARTAEPLDPETVTAAESGPAVALADNSVTSKTALEVLATLPVKGKAPSTGYQRTADFGAAWLDVDRNGCDTRNDILSRDLTDAVRQGPCKVLSGTLDDKYTGQSIHFVRGAQTSALVQIDHIVPLQNAWITGAQKLTQAQRISLANDPLNLMAVDGKSNAQKSAGDAATWLPANKPFRCEYVARQISVKATYGLWVTSAERAAMKRILSGCSSQAAESSAFTPAAPTPTPTVAAPAPAPAAPAPAPVPVPVPVAPAVPAAPAPAPPAPPAPAPPAPAPPAQDVYYANCDAVRAAGAAPIHIGQPGYSRKLDRDGDGIGCE